MLIACENDFEKYFETSFVTKNPARHQKFFTPLKEFPYHDKL